MVAAGAVFMLVGRRNETVVGLIDQHDERINRIDTGAGLFAGMVVPLAVSVVFMVEIARGQDDAYYQLGRARRSWLRSRAAWLRFRL